MFEEKHQCGCWLVGGAAKINVGSENPESALLLGQTTTRIGT